MNVFYEEDGGFKVGSILADNDTSLQVEAPHGKRSKVKTANVLFRFDQPIQGFLDAAQKAAEQIDLDFLWECCPQDEFAYDTLAKEYFGHPPNAYEAAALLLRLHAAPMYFYKKGKGRYRPAPPDALKAALASVERKRLQALQQAQYVEQLEHSHLPDTFQPLIAQLLYAPNRNTIEVKALEEAAASLRLTPLQLLERCGAVPSSHQYHLNRFLFEHFSRGTGFPEVDDDPPAIDLPLSEVKAFSIDDVTTTEIDDAFSVTPLHGGGWQVGVHIAAPALGVQPGGVIDGIGAARLSTVYMPGCKITMLPDPVIARYSLAEGEVRPAVSLYLEVSADLAVRASRTVVERLRIAANLRHASLEEQFNEDTLAVGVSAFPFAQELKLLWELAEVLEAGRGRPEPMRGPQMDYNFYVDGDRVRIVERRRGSPVDKLVAEMMILVNSEWGRALAEAGVAAIYRAQGNGKVRMSTVPSAHQGLGVPQYIWASSPLRRYVDLVNQRQIIAWNRGEPVPYSGNSEALLTAMRDFESAYETYAEFQRTMERYWCLRWLLQEQITVTRAEVLRENLVKIDRIPLTARVASLPDLNSGAVVSLTIANIDLLDLTFQAEYAGPA
ncbi:MAG: ribonuclease II [Proteobacteria bacterium]|nr:MAG: ribonuclease II [Pseudomonadota bacterium]